MRESADGNEKYISCDLYDIHYDTTPCKKFNEASRGPITAD